jgi:hypothetical protein
VSCMKRSLPNPTRDAQQVAIDGFFQRVTTPWKSPPGMVDAARVWLKTWFSHMIAHPVEGEKHGPGPVKSSLSALASLTCSRGRGGH